MLRTPEDICSIEAESGVLGTLVKHPEYYFTSEHLVPQDFSNTENGYLYYAIGELAKKNVTTIDTYAILNIFNMRESTRQWSTRFTQHSIDEFLYNAAFVARDSIAAYQLLVDIVVDKSFRRKMLRSLSDCERLCYSDDVLDLPTRVYSQIDSVIANHHIYSDDAALFSTKVDDMWENLRKRQQQGGIIGYASKIERVSDFWTYEPEELVVVCAARKEGKSILCMNELVNLLRQGAKVLYIDSEMSDRQQYIRLLSHLTGVSVLDIKRGTYDQEATFRVAEANAWLKTCHYHHAYETQLNKDRISILIKRLLNTTGLDFVIVDYIKSSGSNSSNELYNILGEYTDFLKNRIAGEFKLPVLAAAQLNRGGEIADSYKIEQFCSVVNILKRKTEDQIRQDGRDCGNYKLFIRCNRLGEQMVDMDTEYIDLVFRGRDLSFTQAPKQHQTELPY